MWALRIEGRSAEALAEARNLAAMAQPCALTACTVPGCHAPESKDPNGGRHYQRFSAAFVLTVALLGDAPELAELEDDKPPPELEYHLAMWHFAVGMVHARLAQARLGDLEGTATHVQKATESLRALEVAAASPGLSAAEEGGYRHPVVALCAIAQRVLRATAHVASMGDEGAAAARTALPWLREAVKLESGLEYDEPPTQYFPTRHNLGAALIQAGQRAEARSVLKQALQDFPQNGWALHGMAQLDAACASPHRFRGDACEDDGGFAELAAEAWSRADVVLVDSATIELPARAGLHGHGVGSGYVLCAAGLLCACCLRRGQQSNDKSALSLRRAMQRLRGASEKEKPGYGELDRLL